MAHQQKEKIKFLGAKLDLVFPAMDFVRSRIKFQILHSQHIQRRIGFATQQRIRPRREFLEGKWLSDVIVCAQVQRLDSVRNAVARTQHHHRRFQSLGTELFQQLQSIRLAEVQIKND